MDFTRNVHWLRLANLLRAEEGSAPNLAYRRRALRAVGARDAERPVRGLALVRGRVAIRPLRARIRERAARANRETRNAGLRLLIAIRRVVARGLHRVR